MELDQIIFKKLSSFYRRLRAPKVDSLVESRTVYLEEIKDHLCLMAKVMTGRAIEIATAEAEGGWREDVFFLPSSFSEAPTKKENESFYLFRVAYLAQQKELGYNAFQQALSLEQAREEAQKSSLRILKSLFSEYPKLEHIYFKLKEVLQDQPHYLWGHWMTSSLPSSIEEKKKSNLEDQDSSKTEITSELKAKPCEEVEVLEVDQKAIEDYSLGHNFEKVETLEEFKGNWRDLDGSDDLQEHAEALDELNLNQMVRVNQTTHSLLQADFLSAGTLTESKEISVSEHYYLYDEWNYQKRTYRKDYCKVLEKVLSKKNEGFGHKTLQKYGGVLRELQKKFSAYCQEWEMHRRQKEGVDLDLDALVEGLGDLAAGKPLGENLYINSRRSKKDLALVLLLDCSLSTDAFTQGERILEVEKSSVYLFSEFLDQEFESFQIAAFSSRTRNRCEYKLIKDFNQPWARSRSLLGGLESVGYTRIGPALRHASKHLEKIQAKQKWILLLSDGKPNDYDRYEGEYGIHDVRQCIREMNRRGIQSYALAIEAQAKHYLPRMLGQNNFKILPRPQLLPEALSDFYTRVKCSG